MKERIGIMLLKFLVISNVSFSQIDLPKKGKIDLKFAPLSILDANLHTVQFGLDYYFSEKYSVQIEYGQKFPFFKNTLLRGSYKGGNGFRIKAETHFYFGSNRYHIQYVGVETFYWNNKYYSSDYLRDTVSNKRVDFDYKVNKQAFGFSIKYGHMFTVLKKLNFEYYVGVGLKYFDISNPDRIINRPGYVPYFQIHKLIGPEIFPDLEKYSGWRFNLPIGFRICYNIK